MRNLWKETTCGRSRRRWENDITTNVVETIWDGVDWINLVFGRSGGLLWPGLWTFVFQKMWGFFFTSWGAVSFSRRTLLHGVVSCYTVLGLSPARFVTLCREVPVSRADTVKKIIMKTSNDSVKECIAKVICVRNKRHLSTFLNTKAFVNPTAFYGLKL
jgi:hypothetical protein